MVKLYINNHLSCECPLRKARQGWGGEFYSFIYKSGSPAGKQAGRQVGSESDGEVGMWAGLEKRKTGSQAG